MPPESPDDVPPASPPSRLREGEGAARLRADESAAEAAPPNELALQAEPKNDLGNARRLRARHGQDLAFIQELARDKRDAWLAWNGRIWQREAWGEAARRAHLTAEGVKGEALALEDSLADEIAALQEPGAPRSAAKRLEQLRDSIAKHHGWAVTSGNLARTNAMLDQAVPYLLVRSEQLDADPWKLAVANGTLVLPKDGQGEIPLEPGRRADWITREAGVAYDPGADCPRFKAFLATVQPDPAVRAFLQRHGGYSLTGSIEEQIVMLFFGLGGNGKSTYLNTIGGVLGGYHLEVPFESFVTQDKKRGGEATPDLVGLPGMRLATAQEPEANTRLSEASIKRQTGGEKMTLRPLFQGMQRFTPTHKIILSFNNKPKIVAQDIGTWRRLAMVHWAVALAGEKKAPTGEPWHAFYLRTEGPGILNWLLDGFRAWREGGLVVPDSVKATTQEYRRENDKLADFESEMLQRAPDATVVAAELYRAYCLHAKAAGDEHPLSQTSFGKRMQEKGYDKVRSGVVAYQNLWLNRDRLAELEAADTRARYGGER